MRGEDGDLSFRFGRRLRQHTLAEGEGRQLDGVAEYKADDDRDGENYDEPDDVAVGVSWSKGAAEMVVALHDVEMDHVERIADEAKESEEASAQRRERFASRVGDCESDEAAADEGHAGLKDCASEGFGYCR